MRVYLNRTFPYFSNIVLVACLGKVGHYAGAPLGAHILNGKWLRSNFKIANSTISHLRMGWMFEHR